MSPRDIQSWPKPRLTGSGRTRAEYANDAPRALRGLSMTQVPTRLKGNAQRGAFARGWVDGVRRLSMRRNPYERAGSGWHHGMAQLYRDGWRAGRDVHDVPTATVMPSVAEFHRRREVHARVREILDAVHA